MSRGRGSSGGGTAAHLARLEARLDSHADDLHKISAQLDVISEQQAKAREAPWAHMLTGAGVIVAATLGIVTLMLDGYRADIDRLDGLQSAARSSEVEELTERARWMGSTDTHLAALDKRLLALDETLQREMRLLDATGDAKLASLDKRLQQEMRLLVEPMKQAIADTREAVSRNAGDLDQMRRTRFTEADGYRIDERLREVEKAIEVEK